MRSHVLGSVTDVEVYTSKSHFEAQLRRRNLSFYVSMQHLDED